MSEDRQKGYKQNELSTQAWSGFGGADSGNPPPRSPLAESVSRIRHLIRKDFLQIVRNKQNVRMLVIAPLFQLFLFGYAVRLDVREIPTVVADMDRSALSRQVIDAFSRSGYFHIKHNLSSYDQVDKYLENGEASMALLIPPDLERRIKGDRTANVGVLIDGVDTTLANTAAGYANAVVQQVALDLVQDRLKRARGLRYSQGQPDLVIPGVVGMPRAWFNANLESKEFFVPGILAVIMTFFSITLTTMALVREKETGTIEQLMVTPIGRIELIVGKTVPCFVFSVANLIVLTVIVLGWFQPPFRGSLLFFFLAAILHLITCLGLGMTISAFCRNQQQAMLSSFMVLQPSVLLSGFAFPIENMPTVIQYITYINPLRYFIIVVREVFIKGIGPEILWPQIVPMLVMAIGFGALASALFKKRID